MRFRKLIGVMGLAVCLSGCSTTGNLTSENKIPNTTAGLGERYLFGYGVPQSNEKAFAYFSRAAKEGDVFAQNELAYLYASGKGTAQSYPDALHWYRAAAEKGLASAQYNLALMYLHGLGTPVNKTEAMGWLKKSAAHQFEPAVTTLKQYTA